MPVSAWNRYMVKRGPRHDGGTWVMMDSDGVHFISHDPGDGRGYVTLGKWCHEEEMWDYPTTPGFQKRFLNEDGSEAPDRP